MANMSTKSKENEELIKDIIEEIRKWKRKINVRRFSRYKTR